MTCSGGTTIDSVDGGALSYNDADQTTGNGTVAHSDSGGSSASSGTVSVPSTTSGNPVAAFLTNGSGSTVFTTGTSQWVFNSANNGGAGAFAMATETSAGGTASVAWTQASDFYAAQAFEILPASSPPAHTPNLLMGTLP